ncbi:Uncharacterised protein [Mycobacteroides abscessus subsp. abscessus]|nr:Uncharacterised protein [Mycobacteroides abscessus subsp. abscessus]
MSGFTRGQLDSAEHTFAAHHSRFAGDDSGAVGSVDQGRPQHGESVEKQLKHPFDPRTVDSRRQPNQDRQRESTIDLALIHPRNHRQRWHLTVISFSRQGIHVTTSVNKSRELTDGRCGQHHARGDHQVAFTCLVDQGNRDNTVDSEREEVLVDTRRGSVEQLCTAFAEHAFGCGGRLCLFAGRTAGQGLVCEALQRAAVELAVHRDGQLRKMHQARGHHVRRQPVGQTHHGPGRVERIFFTDNKSNEARTPGTTHDSHRGGLDIRLQAQRRLDLTDLDPVATNLYLRVGPSQIGETTVWQSAYEIAGAVHPLACPPRIGHEGGRRHRRLSRVTAGQLGAREIQLADGTIGHRP